jgi:hypothetical protein
MENEQYILPGELAVLAAFLLAPPLAFGLACQGWYLTHRKTPRLRIGISMVATVGLTITLVVILVLVTPSLVPRALGVKEVFIGSTWLPVLPFGFVIVAGVVPVTSLWAARRRR